jgi:hypothetical protein
MKASALDSMPVVTSVSRERTCLDCGDLKPASAFTPIRGTNKVYGRCKACRARRAREAKARVAEARQVEPTRASRPRRAKRQPKPGAIREKPRRSASAPRPLATERTCTDCGQTKPLTGFLRIRANKAGYYGRCRTCRNAKARARYHSNEPARLAEIERSKRNSQRRKLASQLAVA